MFSLPQTEQEWINYLSARHDAERPRLRALDDEYELRSPRMYMHPEIFREVGERIPQLILAWPPLVVDSVEERLDVEGFRLPDEDAADDDMWRVWQENSLDEESQLAHVDALVMKRGYLCAGANEDDADTPLVTVESPLEVYADIDPRTRRVRAALRRWQENADDLARITERFATLYLPNSTVYYDVESGWREVDRVDHGLGQPPVFPIVNRARTQDRYGRSEMALILSLAHAGNKLATDMMVAAEFVALPLRGIFGIGPGDLEDQDGNPMTALQAILGRLLTIPGEGGREFEFPSANLANFHDSIRALANIVASVAGLDPNQLGIHTDSPASADAIRAREARLIKRVERKQRAFGGTYEQVMRLVRRLQEGDWDPKYRRLETIWRDAATPTIAQRADAATKLFQAGIVPLRQTREDMAYTEAQIDRMEAEDARVADRDPIAEIARGLSDRLPEQPETAAPEPVMNGAVG